MPATATRFYVRFRWFPWVALVPNGTRFSHGMFLRRECGFFIGGENAVATQNTSIVLKEEAGRPALL